MVVIADGLGHGVGAAEAAQEAIATFKKQSNLGPGEILSYMHDAFAKPVGLLPQSWRFGPNDKSLLYAGVGNISGVVLPARDSRSLVSHNGTLGITAPRIQEFRSDWPPDAVLVLHSDGIQSKWDLSSYRRTARTASRPHWRCVAS